MAQSSCCGPSEAVVESTSGAARFYSTKELAGLPDSVTGASAGCGNPIAIAELQPGEVVLDLGSGGGIDCFLAAKQVGPAGRVIGLDMTPDMIRLARRNARKIGATNVEFDYGEMEDIPLPDESVDVIISNCVINLSPDKDAVFAEAYRVLRPGGRLSVSDIVVDGDLPPSIRSRLDAWAGCIAGALDESVYLGKIRAAGFDEVKVVSRDYTDPDQLSEEEMQLLVVRADGQVAEGEEARALLDEAGISPRDLARKVASIKVTAHKPA
jgi:SAM-dependent methyltransferase